MNKTSKKNGQANILIVDDSPENLGLLTEMLKQKGYKVRPAPNGQLAIKAARHDPPDLILLDITMPGMDGFQVCEELKDDTNLREIPVIFISALAESIDIVKAFSLGGVDYITKPFQIEEVHARVDTHLKIHHLNVELEHHNKNLEELVQSQVKEISESQMATIFALARLAESRDDDTGEHLERVQLICRNLATKLRENSKYTSTITDIFIENIYYASPLHDIGKVAIPDTILLKPGKLTSDEWDIMKTHAELGAGTLESVRINYPKNSFVNMGIDIAQHHHEHWDGGGYPNGLEGEDIPLCARIMSVADAYDALRSKRCYKEPFSHEQSTEIIIKGKNSQFDPVVVDAFMMIADEVRALQDSLRESNS